MIKRAESFETICLIPCLLLHILFPFALSTTSKNSWLSSIHHELPVVKTGNSSFI